MGRYFFFCSFLFLFCRFFDDETADGNCVRSEFLRDGDFGGLSWRIPASATTQAGEVHVSLRICFHSVDGLTCGNPPVGVSPGQQDHGGRKAVSFGVRCLPHFITEEARLHPRCEGSSFNCTTVVPFPMRADKHDRVVNAFNGPGGKFASPPCAVGKGLDIQVQEVFDAGDARGKAGALVCSGYIEFSFVAELPSSAGFSDELH